MFAKVRSRSFLLFRVPTTGAVDARDRNSPLSNSVTGVTGVTVRIGAT